VIEVSLTDASRRPPIPPPSACPIQGWTLRSLADSKMAARRSASHSSISAAALPNVSASCSSGSGHSSGMGSPRSLSTRMKTSGGTVSGLTSHRSFIPSHGGGSALPQPAWMLGIPSMALDKRRRQRVLLRKTGNGRTALGENAATKNTLSTACRTCTSVARVKPAGEAGKPR